MNAEPAILVTRGAASASRRSAADPALADRLLIDWARQLARNVGARTVFAPPFVPARKLLDVAGKSLARWIVTAAPHEALVGTGLRPFHSDYGLLLRRAPAPVLSVQPWAELPPAGLRTAVVGVDPSPGARAAAHAAAELLSTGDAPSRLILAHGLSRHPAELAAATPWPRLTAAARPDANPWIFRLAQDLAAQHALRVDVALMPTWAPDLVAGLARRESADFTALGIAARCEGDPEAALRIARIHERVLRSSACPLLTASALQL